MSSQLFNPFAVFSRAVPRKFLIQHRDHEIYTEEELNELVPHNLRTYRINGQVWYLAKDVTSFLGITPDHASRALKKLDQSNVRQEEITLNTSDATRGVTGQKSQTHTMYLISESGIYELIHKSRTVYAIDFQAWLVHQVLPSIRTTGQYVAPPSMQVDIAESKADQEQREFEMDCADEKQIEENKQEVVDGYSDGDIDLTEEMDGLKQAVENAMETMVVQRDLVDQGKKESESMLQLLRIMQASMDKDREDRKRERDEYIQEKEKKEREHRRELELHRMEREQDKRDKEDIKQVLSELRSKIDIIVVKDRIVPPPQDERREVFIVMYTHEEDYGPQKKSEWRLPYYVIKCQQGTKAGRIKALKAKYPQAEIAFELPNPNPQSMFDMLKKKTEQRKMPVRFYFASFYFTDNTLTFENIKNLIDEIERERISV